MKSLYNNLWGHFRAIFWSIQLPFFLQKKRKIRHEEDNILGNPTSDVSDALTMGFWIFEKRGFRIGLGE